MKYYIKRSNWRNWRTGEIVFSLLHLIHLWNIAYGSRELSLRQSRGSFFAPIPWETNDNFLREEGTLPCCCSEEKIQQFR